MIKDKILKDTEGNMIKIEPKGLLTTHQMEAIKWFCINSEGCGKINFLNKKQINQLTKYILNECEKKYSKKDTLRYTILRDYITSLIITY